MILFKLGELRTLSTSSYSSYFEKCAHEVASVHIVIYELVYRAN